MNKAQLLTDLQSRVIRLIGDPQLKTDVGGVKTYIQAVLAMEGTDKAADRNVAFYVVDEGQPGEAAYYRDTVHRQTDDREKAVSYMGQLVVNGQIGGFEIESVQADLGSRSFFIAKVYADDGSGKLVEKRFHVSRNAQNQVVRKEII